MNDDRDPFFIGWLPMPKTYARRLGIAVAIVLAFTAGVALALALPQHHPGSGAWEDTSTTFEGVITAEPYAMLHMLAPDGSIMTVLLVEEGKHGARERARLLEGLPVRATGTLLHRDGQRMLELAPGDAGLQGVTMSADTMSRLMKPTTVTLGPATLQGEIVDSKCYLGAMKPGQGKTHRGCARLCLQGGVPPMFRTSDGQLLLLCNADGSSLDSRYFELVGSPITISGNRIRTGNLDIFQIHSVIETKK